MSNIEKAIIEIDKQYGTSILITKDNGLLSRKFTTIEAIQEVLMENFQFSTGWLPAGTRHFSKSDRVEQIIIESPPAVRKVAFNSHSGHGEYTIPVPWTLWKFVLVRQGSSARLSESGVWAMKNPITPGRETSHPIYRFPFSNVSGGSICWGHSDETNNVMKSIDSAGKVGRMIEMFWSAPFNSDLDGDKYRSFANEGGVRISHCHSLLQHLDGKASFPYDILIEDCTLGSLSR